MLTRSSRFALLAATAAAALVTGCASRGDDATSDRGLMGGLFGGGASQTADQPEAGIGVNSYLWRASLEDRKSVV